MDPKYLSTADWAQIIPAVNGFWLFAAFLVAGALSFGLAHGIIASLQETGQASQWLGRSRLLLYLVSLVGVAMAAVTLYRAALLTYSILRNFYPRWWV